MLGLYLDNSSISKYEDDVSHNIMQNLGFNRDKVLRLKVVVAKQVDTFKNT